MEIVQTAIKKGLSSSIALFVTLPSLLISLSFTFWQCTASAASSSEQGSVPNDISVCSTPAGNIDYSSLQNEANPEVVKRLKLPNTVIYLGLKEPNKPLPTKAVGSIPDGMVLIPAGKVQIGAEDGFAHELPRFWASLSSFLMDKSPVTVGAFRKFVNATGYKTEAEKFGNAGVINEETGKQWILVEGAHWEYPLGKNHPKAPDNHPVTQVSWNDANAYAKWAGKRLPCEMEWEHAARNAKNTQSNYSWGNEIEKNGKWKANIWQGTFPVKNYVSDQYAYTSPVGVFGKTELGLTDMSGNVWEWMSNPKFDYAVLFKAESNESDISVEYAERGGSFLCEPTWCHGYRVSGRSSSTTETGLFHLGFRCVKDL